MTEEFSFLNNISASAIEELYKDYRENPSRVDPSWRIFFEGFTFSLSEDHVSALTSDILNKEFKVINLINDYRKRGHLFTKTNPVRQRRSYSPTLDIENYGLTKDDLNTKFNAAIDIGLQPTTLENIIEFLSKTYCQSIGLEYTYIRDVEKYEWLKQRIEKNANTPDFTITQKKQILSKIIQAVGFEQFLQKRFTGQKRFSLEGAEALIPALNFIIELGDSLGVKEFVIGMAHRGRLNVLTNVLNQSYQDIFSEFEGYLYGDQHILGDVKYHLGYSAEINCPGNRKVTVSLSPNPSHLESVDPVVEGVVRAKIEQEYHLDPLEIMPILIHGDAAIAGQGVVYEVTQMENLKGFSTGGTIHLVVNNQIGFTTDYLDGRSSTYCTDVAKTTLCPVFHVNGDDPEALTHVIEIATEYRQKFKSDVFIDILCYRRYGHNETDEPRFTQPVLYKLIAGHPDLRNIYSTQLINEGAVSQEELEKMKSDMDGMLQDKLLEARKRKKSSITTIFKEKWSDVPTPSSKDFQNIPDTSVSKEKLLELSEKINAPPEELNIFDKSRKLLESRRQAIMEGNNLDWATCEHLAFASLLDDGISIRMTGQDVERGTFSQRHAVLTIDDSHDSYTPLQHIHSGQGIFSIYNSPLNEFADLGFEYGYALVNPGHLTIWEAQYGDFVNGGQVIIDQFISSAEEKWAIKNGLVLFLPHGYEGQGPDHSSGRMERFLDLCANNNMIIANCSTPANFFHLIRKQMISPYRKPLVVFTPKSLLRNPNCTSNISELASGKFREIYTDPFIEPGKVRVVIVCTGKIFYELLEERKKRNISDVAIIRIEQIYPFPYNKFEEMTAGHASAEKWLWVQEEPENMGSWMFFNSRHLGKPFKLVARVDCGSPADGVTSDHKIHQQMILDAAFA